MTSERALRRLYFQAREEHRALQRLEKQKPPLTDDEKRERRRQRAAAKAAAIRALILANKEN